MQKSYLKKIITTGLIIILIANFCLSAQANSTKGKIVFVRGGFGVVARIDNFHLGDPLSNKSVNWHMLIEGDFVINGESEGTVKPRAIAIARSSVFPPAFGLGDVNITITITEPESGRILSQQKVRGFMLGFIVLKAGS